MATFTFSTAADALGSMSISYEVPDAAIQYLMIGMAQQYGACNPDGTMRAPTELLRCLTDAIMDVQMATIQEVAKQVYAMSLTHTALPPVVTPPVESETSTETLSGDGTTGS